MTEQDDPRVDAGLAEVLGGEGPPDLREEIRGRIAANEPVEGSARRSDRRGGWLAAAIVLLAGIVVAMLAVLAQVGADEDETAGGGRERRRAYVSSLAELEALPADVTALTMRGVAPSNLPRLARLRELRDLELPIEQDAALRVEIDDADLAGLRGLSKLRRLSLSGRMAIDGTGLAALDALPVLSELDLSQTGVDADGLRAIARLPAIRSLKLLLCRGVDDAAMQVVAQMHGLRSLDVTCDVGISRNGFLAIATLTELRDLSVAFNDGGRLLSGWHLDGDGIGVDDGVLHAFGAMKDLRALSIGRCSSLTPAGMAGLAAFEKLEKLGLRGTSVENVHAALLSTPTTVRALDLGETGIEDTDLEWIASRFPELQDLDMSFCLKVTAAGIRKLADLPRLRALSLNGPADAVGIADGLTTLRSLEMLNLDQVRNLSGAHLEGLAQLPRLEELHLTGSVALDDSGLAELAKAPRLKRLHVGKPNHVTVDGLRRLTSLPLELLDLTHASTVRRTGFVVLNDPVLVIADAPAFDPNEVTAIAADAWPGCRVVLPDSTVVDVSR